MQSTKFALNGLVKSSPLFLLVSMVLSFILMLLVQLFYYSELFKELPYSFGLIVGVAIGILTQLARLAFGVSGVAEFAHGKTGRGIASILFSLALTIFESFEVIGVANLLSPTLQGEAMMILQLVVWLGFVLEIRLAINVSGAIADTSDSDDKSDGFIDLLNGTGKKSSNGAVKAAP